MNNEKLMTRLDKLKYFTDKRKDLDQKALYLMEANQKMEVEFKEWVTSEIGLEKDKDYSLPEMIKIILETSIEPSRIIMP